MKSLPEAWSHERCSTCGMVFALPPLPDGSGTTAGEMLREELERHVLQKHVDLPSAAWD